MSAPGRKQELVPEDLLVFVCQKCGLVTLELRGTLCGHMDEDFRKFMFVPMEGRG